MATEQQVTNSKNHFLDEYNGRPTIEKINSIIARKRREGDTEKKIWVDMRWLLELIEYFVSGTNFTLQKVHDAPVQLYKYEQKMLQAQNTANLEKQKAADLLSENIQIYEKLAQLTEVLKDKDGELEAANSKSRVIKLPLHRTNIFLAFCSPEELNNDSENFYVKIDDKGNMERIVRTEQELE